MTQTRPALFISHSKKDEAWALRLHDALVKDGYGAFLDSHPDDGIHPGADWEKMLWRQLQQCGGVVVLCSANWLVSPWCVAEAMIAREHGKKIILLATVDVIDGRQVKGEEGAKDAPRIPDFLKTKQFLPVVGLTEGEVYRRLQRGLKEEKLNEEFKPPERPYPGLKWFEETDAAVFFGRREEIEHVQNVLNLRRLNKAKGFIVVLGASGCGKSSLVRAGVLPRLRRAGEERDSGAEWVIVPSFFGREGLEGLAWKLETAFDEAGKPEAPDSISEQLEAVREQKGEKEGPAKALRKLAKSLLRAHGLPDAHVLVVLDQLEEVFAPDTGSDARAMLRLLLDVSVHPASRVVVLATMRSDFLNDFQLFEGAAERYEKITLDPMPRSRFAEVIEGPAARCALRLGPGLTERMVEDTKYSDALPLLAFTLEKLYEEGSADGELTLEEYERLFPETEVRAADGTQTTERGVVCAIKKVADEILKQTGFAGLKDEDPRMRDLRRAFYSLSQVGEEGQFTRRSARWSQMPISCKEVLRRFVERRLLVSSGREDPAEEDQTEGILSVAHEALFRVWDTLNGWLREDRKALALRTQIEEAASEWQAENRADSRAWAEERVLDAVREIQVSGVSLADVADPNTVDAFLGPTDREELEVLPFCSAEQASRYGESWRLPLNHGARSSAGVRLALLQGGDRRKGVGLRADGLPDIDWVRIDGGKVTIEIRTNPDDPNSKVVKRLSRLVEAFWMARYPVTIAQFGAFLEDCYQDGQWRLPP